MTGLRLFWASFIAILIMPCAAQAKEIELSNGKWESSTSLIRDGQTVDTKGNPDECLSDEDNKFDLLDLALKLSSGPACAAQNIVHGDGVVNFTVDCPDAPEFDNAKMTMGYSPDKVVVTAAMSAPNKKGGQDAIQIVTTSQQVGMFCTSW